MKKRLIPKFYSFISFRYEDSGGFLFNPHMLRELPLDSFESGVAAFCDGSTPLSTIIESMSLRFKTDLKTSEKRIADAILKFTNYFALRWLSTPEPSPKENNTSQKKGAGQGRLSAPLSVLWELTYSCNLKCRHCLSSCGDAKPGYWSLHNGKALIDELAEEKVFQITMGGGEPLMHRHVMAFIHHATKKNLGIKLSTNGVLVNKRTIDELAGMNVFAVQVSIDGLEPTHDYLRRKKGSFQKAVNALRLFSQAGYYTVMNVSVNSRNVDDVGQLPEIARSMGVSTLKIGLCASLGRAKEHDFNTMLSPANFYALLNKIQEAEAKFGEALNFQYDGLYPWLLDKKNGSMESCQGHLSDHQKTVTSGIGCSAGISQIVISPEGDVYPCAYIRISDGKLPFQSLRYIWENSRIFSKLRNFDSDRIKGKCNKCTHRKKLCFGGCRGLAFAATGDLYAEDPNCWANA